MSQSRRPLVAGNWKMNGHRSHLTEIDAICAAVGAGDAGQAEVLVCPPFTLLMEAARRCAGSAVGIGAQDCHQDQAGAHTGDIAADMLKDAGATYVIVGHSERRIDHDEDDALVRAKAQAGLRAGLDVILCVGETEAQRTAGAALQIVAAQLRGSLPPDCHAARLVVAYEPVWAIGTGLTPTPHDVGDMHSFIRRQLAQDIVDGAQVRILYGGSVKRGNAAELLNIANVDGALVGGASLTANDFMAIAAVCR